MTPEEKLAYWLRQPASEQRDYWIAAMNRILSLTSSEASQR